MPIRKKLKETIQEIYRTQDRCAYEIGIDSAVLSRIINCTKDPTHDQMELLSKNLCMTSKEINKKDV